MPGMKVIILVNANARAVRRERIPLGIFNRFLSDRVSLRVTKSVDDIEGAVGECWDSDVDLVLLTTGDGGLHRFLSSFVQVYRTRGIPGGPPKPLPVFATLRSGTANLITGVLGGRGNPRKAVARLFSVLQNVGSPKDLPRIKQKLLAVSDGIQERFGFIAGSGAIYRFFLEYYEGSRHSVLKFFKILGKALLSLFSGTGYIMKLFSSMEARMKLDEKIQGLSHWKMLAVSAIDARVVFFKAFRVGKLVDRIHVKAGSPSRLAIIGNIPNLLFNRSLRGREILDRLAKRVRFERDSEFGYTIDGELYRAKSLLFEPGPLVEFLRF